MNLKFMKNIPQFYRVQRFIELHSRKFVSQLVWSIFQPIIDRRVTFARTKNKLWTKQKSGSAGKVAVMYKIAKQMQSDIT